MRYFLFFLIISVFTLLQATVLNIFQFFHATPDFLLISLVVVSLTLELRWVIFFAVFLGVFKDIFSAHSFGVNTFLFAVFAVTIFKLSRKIFIEDNYSRVILVLSTVLAYHFILYILFNFTAKYISLWTFLRIGVLDSLYSALFFPVAYYIFKSVSLKEN